jgi:hypothetical protein
MKNRNQETGVGIRQANILGNKRQQKIEKGSDPMGSAVSQSNQERRTLFCPGHTREPSYRFQH